MILFFRWCFSDSIHSLKWQRIVAWGILGVSVLWCIFNVYRYAVDVPYADDWDYLLPLENFTFENIVGVHVQHRVMFTELMFSLGYLIDHLNIRNLIFVNFIIYFGMVSAMLLAFRDKLKNFPWYPLFFLPFFSDLPETNLLWAGQSQFHFMLLFAMLGIYFGFNKEPSIMNSLIFSMLLACSIFSMSPLFPIILFAIWLVRQFLLYRSTPPNSHRKILYAVVLATCCVLTALGIFFIKYTAPLTFSSLSLLSLDFWLCLRASLMHAFCVVKVYLWNTYFLYLLALCYAVPYTLILFILIVRKKWMTSSGLVTLSVVGFVIALCCAVIYTRGYSLTPRHTEAVLPLIPAMASVFGLIEVTRLRNIGFYSYLFCILISLSLAFSFRESEVNMKERLQGLETVQKKASPFVEKLRVPALHCDDISNQVRRAVRLNISCFQKMNYPISSYNE